MTNRHATTGSFEALARQLTGVEEVDQLRQVLIDLRDAIARVRDLGISDIEREALYLPARSGDAPPRRLSAAEAKAMADYIIASDRLLPLAYQAVERGIPRKAVLGLVYNVMTGENYQPGTAEEADR